MQCKIPAATSCTISSFAIYDIKSNARACMQYSKCESIMAESMGKRVSMDSFPYSETSLSAQLVVFAKSLKVKPAFSHSLHIFSPNPYCRIMTCEYLPPELRKTRSRVLFKKCLTK